MVRVMMSLVMEPDQLVNARLAIHWHGHGPESAAFNWEQARLSSVQQNVKTQFLALAFLAGVTVAWAGDPVPARNVTNGPAAQNPKVRPVAPEVAPSVNRLFAQRPALPAPGIYETAPFTCIVVVPGPHPDDRCIRSPAVGPFMPTVRPDLRFIPRAPR
jgi:hypothetical protein